MADNTHIQWCDATVNAVVGCSRFRDGCDNCYAISMVRRMAGMPAHQENYEGLVEDGDWTGDVAFLPGQLEKPKRWKKPRRIFMNSLGDWFYGGVEDEWRDAAWEMMKVCCGHTFIILTKRPWTMKRYIERRGEVLPNLWLGVSVENQKRADFRVPILVETPAAKRVVSVEPMLGPVDLSDDLITDIDWVICGGETGTKARPMHPDWARGLRDQCIETRIPFWFKQWGEWEQAIGGGVCIERTHDFDDGTVMIRVGRKAAGDFLDDQQWHQVPDISSADLK
jgi:protein gp37